MKIEIDDVTYYIVNTEKENRYQIRAGHPYTYLTDDMTKKQVELVAKSMRQLGFTVIDKTTSTELKLTELEKDWLGGFREGDCMYVCHIEGYTEKITSQQISGVVSSLSKKGLLVVDKHDGDEVNTLTEVGREVVKQLHNTN